MSLVTTHLDLNDLPHVLDIEYDAQNIWCRQDFINAIKYNVCLVLKNTLHKKIVGYSIHCPDKHSKGVEILNFAIATNYRRQKIGTHLLNLVIGNDKFRTIYTHIRESNLAGQLFAKKMGFTCTNIFTDFFDNEPSYFFMMKKDNKIEIDRDTFVQKT